MEQNNKKLSTDIHGLDNLFHGGLHLEQIGKKDPNLIIVVRGEHGTNKIHLAMQMCEGLNQSIIREYQPSNDGSGKSERDSSTHSSNVELITAFDYTKLLIEKKIDDASKKSNDIQINCNNWKKLLDNRIIMEIAQEAFSSQDNLETKNTIFTKVDPSNCILNYIKNRIDKLNDASIDELLKGFSNPSPSDQDTLGTKEMLFVSLNKDDEKVKEFYYDFYVKRLIRNIQIKAEGWNDKDGENDISRIRGLFDLTYNEEEKKIELGETLPDIIAFLSKDESIMENVIQNGDNDIAKRIHKVFASGVLYYNTRTHGLHIRQQTRNDDSNETQLLTINYKSNHLPKIEFWGRTKLSGKNEMADNRTIFFNLVQELEKKESKHFNCIMIDGLSMLTPEESEDCPINALIDLMRKKCTIGILNTNKNQSISKLDSDIVIDLRNRVDEITNHTKKELSIYKCLYQKNTYGWHQYKMRNAGVEVIPSLHKILSRRNYIDESISEAMLSIDKMSYNYWLNENLDPKGPIKQDNDRYNIISKLAKTYQDFCTDQGDTEKYEQISQGKLIALTSFEKATDAIGFAMDEIEPEDHILFVDLKRSRKDFWDYIKNTLQEKSINFENIHYFGFRAGCIYADEFLYILEQQVSAIAREIKEKEMDNESQTQKQKYHYYKKVHIVMGDLNLLQYCYPCLYSEQLFIPSISALTKGNYMTNYLYMTDGDDSDGSKRIKKQLLAIADDEKPEKSLSKQGRTNNSESL